MGTSDVSRGIKSDDERMATDGASESEPALIIFVPLRLLRAAQVVSPARQQHVDLQYGSKHGSQCDGDCTHIEVGELLVHNVISSLEGREELPWF